MQVSYTPFIIILYQTNKSFLCLINNNTYLYEVGRDYNIRCDVDLSTVVFFSSHYSSTFCIHYCYYRYIMYYLKIISYREHILLLLLFLLWPANLSGRSATALKIDNDSFVIYTVVVVGGSEKCGSFMQGVRISIHKQSFPP